jgi:hypothetical protein
MRSDITIVVVILLVHDDAFTVEVGQHATGFLSAGASSSPSCTGLVIHFRHGCLALPWLACG